MLKTPAFWYVCALGITGLLQTALGDDRARSVRGWTSTNLHNLSPVTGHPIASLVTSALFADGWLWLWPLVGVSAFFVVDALGARRAVAALAAVHVGVTLATQGMVAWRINAGLIPEAARRQFDTGPSYVIVAALVVAIACARPRPFRLVAALLLAGMAPSLLEGLTSYETGAVGHLASAAAGLLVALWTRRRVHVSQQAPASDLFS